MDVSGIERLEYIFELINERGVDGLAQLVKNFREDYGFILVYDSLVPDIQTICLVHKGGAAGSVSFGGPDFLVNCGELERRFGKHRHAYNWRDDITCFFFERFKDKRNVSSIAFDKHGELRFDTQKEIYIEYREGGAVTEHSSAEGISFNNFRLDLYSP
jgi:hypothetical protein